MYVLLYKKNYNTGAASFGNGVRCSKVTVDDAVKCGASRYRSPWGIVADPFTLHTRYKICSIAHIIL